MSKKDLNKLKELYKCSWSIIHDTWTLTVYLDTQNGFVRTGSNIEECAELVMKDIKEAIAEETLDYLRDKFTCNECEKEFYPCIVGIHSHIVHKAGGKKDEHTCGFCIPSIVKGKDNNVSMWYNKTCRKYMVPQDERAEDYIKE